MTNEKIEKALLYFKAAVSAIENGVLILNEVLGEDCAVLDFAAYRRTKLRVITPSSTETKTPDAGTSDDKDEEAFFNFTEKEIAKMPKFIKNQMKLKGGNVAHIRKKPNGTFEIRYRRNGLDISVSSKTLSLAKERFIERLNQLNTDGTSKTVLFSDFACTWLNVVKRPHVGDRTIDSYERTLKNYVFPAFGSVQLRNVRPLDVQKLLSDMLDAGNGRTAGMIYTLLKPIFDFAVAEEVIARSPMALIKKPKHEVKHGCALTLEEEKALTVRLLSSDSPLRWAFLFLLYTGIRRSELPSAELSPSWVTVVTAKTRKGENKKTRRIPVSPMLQPLLSEMTKERLSCNIDTLTHDFPKFAPGHHLHDLRHTFITRCQECGIPREVVSLWAGHKADNTMTSNVYTHFSDAFQLSEIEKLTY